MINKELIDCVVEDAISDALCCDGVVDALNTEESLNYLLTELKRKIEIELKERARRHVNINDFITT